MGANYVVMFQFTYRVNNKMPTLCKCPTLITVNNEGHVISLLYPTHLANPVMVHVLHCTEYPRSTFVVMDSGNCLVADISFDIIMSHLKGFFVLRKGLNSVSYS